MTGGRGRPRGRGRSRSNDGGGRGGNAGGGRPRGRGRGRSRSNNGDTNNRPRTRSRVSDSTTAGEATPAAAAATSIRATAINYSRSAGSQNSQDSSHSFYNLNYHRRGRGEEEIMGGGINLDAIGYNPRICICDQQLYPITCNECDLTTNTACARHIVVQCTASDCTRRFHKECICSGCLTDSTVDELAQSYICPKCTCESASSDDAPFSTFGETTTVPVRMREMMLRFGIDPPIDASETELTAAFARMKKLKKAFHACHEDLVEKCPGLPEEDRNRIIKGILDTKPKPYPSPVGMDSDAVRRHVSSARRAEISLLMHQVKACGCCGSVKPHHSDPGFPDSAPLKRMHLINQSHDAWHCTCKAYCKGSQFYSARRGTNVMRQYMRMHDQMTPEQYAAHHPDTVVAKTVLCQKCHEEVAGDKAGVLGLTHTSLLPWQDLQHGYTFSVRNGFGPAHTVPEESPDEDENIRLSRELHGLMSSLTAVEEAAIRQISPLISILRLTSGNIGSKGNTSCVWQHSKLTKILPNLPSECNYIILRRGNASSSTFKSTKFERRKIQRVLELLKLTGHDAWKDITISQENIDAWPERGDLGEVIQDLVVQEVDDDEVIVDTGDAGDGQAGDGGVQLAGDGNDTGPAPLQNDVIQTETFEGVLRTEALTESAAANANLIATAVGAVVRNARGEGTNASSNSTNPPNANNVNVYANSHANLPQPEFNRNQTTATFQHNDVLRVDGFADMNRTPFAWARAFPSLFIPVYTVKNHATSDYGWVIFHDITGWSGLRDKIVNRNQWYEHMMWRSDGRPAAHPTFGLVLYNHKVKNYLQRQGQFLINTSDFDPTTTIEQIKEATDEDTIRSLTQKLLEKALVHSGNQPGTSAYQKATYHEFIAHSFFQQYICGNGIDVFLTGSLAEFHEHYLRVLLAKYVAQLSPSPPDLDPESILTDDNIFSDAVQRYKNVVTNYLASKEEIWFAFMYNQVYGVLGGNVAHEFAMSRGAIHYHATCQTSSQCMTEVAAALKLFSVSISDAMDVLNEFIHDQSENKEDNPSKHFTKESLQKREEFCKNVEDGSGTVAWEAYLSAVEEAQSLCSKNVGKAMESHFGLHAMHTGIPPDDWVKPGGQALGKESNYRSTDDNMQSSQNVRDRRELKMPKYQRENDLFERGANICNHCGTHKCSDYCWKEIQHTRKFDPERDADVPDNQRFSRRGDDGQQQEYVNSSEYQCRMHFGSKLDYDNSGENNLTRGQERRTKVEVIADKNGMPKVHARRNHPRVLQEPYGFPFYNANNDFSFMLKCSCGHELMDERGMEWYEKYANNLVAAGWSGLGEFAGSYITDRYCTGYQCKGNKNSHDFASTVKELIEKYCSRGENREKTIRSLMATCMNEVTKGSSFPRDQALFILSGGKLKRCSYCSTSKCTVNNVKLSEISANATTAGEGIDGAEVGEAVGDDNTDNSFTWPNITKKYKNRPTDLEGLNLYKFVVFHWNQKKHTVPQFFGFPDHCTWPPKEEYSKWMLTFYKPWRHDVNSLKGEHESFAAALMEYYLDREFPDTIRAELWRCKRKESAVDTGSSGIAAAVGGDANYHTPTNPDDRQDDANDDAELAAQFAEDAAEGIGEEETEGDLQDTMFQNLRTSVPEGFDWSESYDESKKDILQKFAKKFYADKNASIINNNPQDEPLELFDPELCKPENTRSEAQQLIIYHHLYSQWKLYQFETAKALHEQDPEAHPPPPPRPPDQHLLIEGLPGTGKTFIIKTIRNMTRKIHKSNRADIAVAPTGCAASHIHGSTTCRTFFIPTGKKQYKKPPENRTVTNASEYKAAQLAFSAIITQSHDEMSMYGIPDYGFVRHRNEEYRRKVEIIPDDEHPADEDVVLGQLPDEVLLPPEVYNRPHGGIPFIYALGDSNQLPPVAKQPVYSTNTPAASTSDAVGKISFLEDFFDPPDPDVVEAYIVVMDEVLRQTDENFLRVLDHMREGTMTKADTKLIADRQIDKLQPEEREKFVQESLHLVPTWQAAASITFDYLQNNLESPIAKMTAKYSSARSDGKNCCVRECRYPQQNALCKDAKVMLLKNSVVELGLMNGAVGKVVSLCYKHANGPYPDEDDDHRDYDDELQYAIVDFPECKIPEDSKFFEGLPRTYIPVPIVEERCEKKCCSVRALPLRCCKALSIHKSQGMTVGPGKPFEYVTVHYPTGNTPGAMSTPGLELVATSRVESLNCLAVGNRYEDLSYQQFSRIGTTKAYDARKAHLTEIKRRAQISKQQLRDKITSADPSANGQTYEGGCNFLLEWYHSITGTTNNSD
eukprot:scaffold23084_cov153-Skeletonema_dohrnii-CCMP3373.AAC.2